MRTHKRPKEILPRGERLRAAIAMAHAANQAHLRRVNRSIANLSGDALGAVLEVRENQASEGCERGDGPHSGGGAN